MSQETYVGRHLNHCVRCGLTHPASRCHSWNAVCNKCRMVGHFARVCSSMEKRPKSNESRKRDKERMAAFIRRKTAEAALPFIHTEDDFILEMQINTSALDSGTIKRQLNDIKGRNTRLEGELQDSRSQCTVLHGSIQESAREINKLKNEIQCLNSKLAEEQHKFQTVNTSLREKETELNDIKLEAIKIKTESKGLQEQLGSLEYFRDQVIDVEKFMSSITNEEFDAPLWEQLNLHIIEMLDMIETKDEEITCNKRLMLTLNDRIRQLQNENQDLKHEMNSIKTKRNIFTPLFIADTHHPVQKWQEEAVLDGNSPAHNCELRNILYRAKHGVIFGVFCLIMNG